MHPTPNDDNRFTIHINADDEAVIMRAVAIEHTDMSSFLIESALKRAQVVIEEYGHIQLSQRDSLLVMELLENPPQPNAKLQRAARALPKNS